MIKNAYETVTDSTGCKNFLTMAELKINIIIGPCSDFMRVLFWH